MLTCMIKTSFDIKTKKFTEIQSDFEKNVDLDQLAKDIKEYFTQNLNIDFKEANNTEEVLHKFFGN